MAKSAEHLIVQYIHNPMRREPKNIGLIVIANGQCTARFIGEVGDSGEIDGRSIKWIAYPGVYRKWIKYWREQLRKNGSDLAERLQRANGDNYDVVRGGFVTDYGTDSPEMICENLFQLLVAPEEQRDIKEVARTVEPEQSSRALEADIAYQFRQLGIMSGHARPSVKHPVLHNMPVSGKLTSHTPQFMQQNEHLTVMESLSFATSRKGPVKHHAGYMAKMFDDIGGYDPKADRIAIIHASSEELRDRTVRYSLDLLKDSAVIVKWNVSDDRNVFLKERERVASGDGNGHPL